MTVVLPLPKGWSKERNWFLIVFCSFEVSRIARPPLVFYFHFVLRSSCLVRLINSVAWSAPVSRRHYLQCSCARWTSFALVINKIYIYLVILVVAHPDYKWRNLKCWNILEIVTVKGRCLAKVHLLYCIILYCIVLYCIVGLLYCVVLYCRNVEQSWWHVHRQVHY